MKRCYFNSWLNMWLNWSTSGDRFTSAKNHCLHIFNRWYIILSRSSTWSIPWKRLILSTFLLWIYCQLEYAILFDCISCSNLLKVVQNFILSDTLTQFHYKNTLLSSLKWLLWSIWCNSVQKCTFLYKMLHSIIFLM